LPSPAAWPPAAHPRSRRSYVPPGAAPSAVREAEITSGVVLPEVAYGWTGLENFADQHVI
ncbi:MAG: hypothetical protein ACFB6S_20160, partial [Geminicoccaceae bacterium]